MTTKSSCNGTFPSDPCDAARLYLSKGLAPIPVPPRSKVPGYRGWQELRLTTTTVRDHFPPSRSHNVGILNGGPSGNRVDVDLDCPESLAIASCFLPWTGWIFGRSSARRSHWIYHVDADLQAAQVKYTDLDGAVLLELRGTGGLTVYPPSIHKETSEQISWDEFTTPGEVKLGDLQTAVRTVAAAALLARHWPAKGQRDAAAMALTGGLLRAGWSEEAVSQFVYAVAIGAGDEEARTRAAKAAPTARKQAEGVNTTGWPALQTLLGQRADEILRTVRDWLGNAVAAQPTEVSSPSVAWPAPPAPEAFSGLAGQIVRAIEPSTEADPAALLIQLLVAFGNTVGRSPHFRVEGDDHHANEFAVLVGKTSKARKGTSWGRIRQVIEQADEQWMAERVASGVSSGEGIIWGVRDAIHCRERVGGKGEVRYEEVVKDPGIEDKRLLLYEPEFANVLKQTERQGNTASVVLRQAWDGCMVLRTMTKNSPAQATSAHISMVGHITAEELQRYLNLTETANGFANRFLFVCTERSKLLPEGGRIDQAAQEQMRHEFAAVLEFARSVGEVKRDDEARAIWCAIYGELSEGKPGLAGALLARAEAHVMRLAMLYALFDQSNLIRAPHLLAALALWDYCDRSVRFVFGDSLGDPVADEILRLLRGSPNGMTRTDISSYFQRNVSADRIGRALGLLMQNRLARNVDEQTAGRPSQRWFAIPR